MSETINPYAAPKAVVDDVGSGAQPEAEQVRRAHINHEASIKAVGLLYYLTGFLLILVAVVRMGPSFAGNNFAAVVLLCVFVGFAILYFYVGHGLRKLKSGVRIPAIVLSVIGLLGFPVGTLINAYILWLLLCAKGRFIFTPEYATIIDATPQVKYRTSVVVWIFVGLLGLLLVAAVAAILIPGHKR